MAVRNNIFDESKIIKKSKPSIEPQKHEKIVLNQPKIEKDKTEIVETKSIDKSYPVFKYEKDPNTLNVEVKNTFKNKKYDFDISDNDLNIIKYNNNKQIVETELDIYILKILISKNDNKKELYKNNLIMMENDLEFLKLKQEILTNLSDK